MKYDHLDNFAGVSGDQNASSWGQNGKLQVTCTFWKLWRWGWEGHIRKTMFTPSYCNNTHS